jgi:hypothetical protein
MGRSLFKVALCYCGVPVFAVQATTRLLDNPLTAAPLGRPDVLTSCLCLCQRGTAHVGHAGLHICTELWAEGTQWRVSVGHCCWHMVVSLLAAIVFTAYW